MSNKFITLIFENKEFKKFEVNTEISQDSSFLLILYLFYNAELIKRCNNLSKRVFYMRFINDMNLLVYDLFTKQNCRLLKKIYKICLN